MCVAYQHYYVSEYTVIPAVKAIRATACWARSWSSLLILHPYTYSCSNLSKAQNSLFPPALCSNRFGILISKLHWWQLRFLLWKYCWFLSIFCLIVVHRGNSPNFSHSVQETRCVSDHESNHFWYWAIHKCYRKMEGCACFYIDVLCY